MPIHIAQAFKIEGKDIVIIITTDGDIWRLSPDSDFSSTFRLERLQINMWELVD